MCEVASKEHMSCIFIACREIYMIQVPFRSYIAKLHSKATWQGYTASMLLGTVAKYLAMLLGTAT